MIIMDKLIEKLEKQEITSEEIVRSYYDRIKEKEDSLSEEDIKRIILTGTSEKIIEAKEFKQNYIQMLKHKLNKNNFDCIFDCANGASTEIVREVFKGCQIIGTDLTGKYINDGFGTENIDTLKSYCKRNKKIGFAFDGEV